MDVGQEVKEQDDAGHEVKSELELGPELLQSDFSIYQALQLRKQAESSESTGDVNDKCTIHVVEEDPSQIDICASADCDVENISNLPCDNQASPKIIERDEIAYINTDSEKRSTHDMAASKTDSQHANACMHALYKANRFFICCRRCRVFNRKRSLLKHLMVHSGDRPFTCIYGYKFIQKRLLKRHIEHNRCRSAHTQEQVQHPENEQYTVAQTVSNSGDLEINLGVAFECDECGESYHLKSELRKHILTHMLLEKSLNMSGHTFSCTVCYNTFATKAVLSDHVKSEHLAHFETAQKCRLMLRQQKHTGKKPYKCSYCDYRAARKDGLKLHVMCKHVNKKPFKCRNCESSFSQKCNLQAHELVHTGEKPYKCRYCSFTSGHYSSVCAHQKLHSGEKPYKCELCDYKAARKRNIKVHVMNVHTRERPIKCNLCSYACRTNSQLGRHMSVHSKKQYECESCSFRCESRGLLKQHVRKHHDFGTEKPLKCDHCEYACSHRYQLKYHAVVHSSEKPYKCEVCSYASKRISALRRHVKIHKSTFQHV